MQNLCQEHNLLKIEDGIVRVPFLVKGQLRFPPQVKRQAIEAAFQAGDPQAQYLRLPDAQVLRHARIDPSRRELAGETLYLVMPVFQTLELVETDFDRLAHEPYALRVEDIVTYLGRLFGHFRRYWPVVEQVRDIYAQISEYPQVFLDVALEPLRAGMDSAVIRMIIDHELSVWKLPGGKFLDGWVELPLHYLSGTTAQLAAHLSGFSPVPHTAKIQLRAMPTRQLHITAGNAPEIPLLSATRMILSKSVGVIKSPADAVLSGALLALGAAAALPEHPFTRNLSVVYWHGGDESIEQTLFAPNAFDRIVVWGSPEAVTSVQARAIYTKVISLNPRYGVSMLGSEVFTGDLRQVASLAACDALIYNQKACTASQLQYVEGSLAQVQEYAACLQQALQAWDEALPPFHLPGARGKLKRMRRGKYAQSEWLINSTGGEFSSGVLVMPGEFDILDHPMSRLVVVRPVERLQDALRYLHAGVSTVGVYPEKHRLELRDAILARGVSSVLPLGQCENYFPAAPQDGMMILNQLVDWKVS